MENQEKKVISIPLIYIIAVIAIIIAIVSVSTKNKKLEFTKTIAKNENIEENVSLTTSRVNENISSRSSETSRQQAVESYSTQESQNSNIEETIPEETSENISDNISENNQETENSTEQEEINTYTSLEDLTISENMDLTNRTNLSKEDFVLLMSRVKADTSKFFYNNAETIYDLCEKYEINEIFFCGLISAESGWNIASNHRSTFNYISLMVNGKLKQFSSVEDGLEQAAKTLHEKYLTPGGKFYYGKTLAGVKTKFCPSSSTWTSLVYGRMKQIYNSK